MATDHSASTVRKSRKSNFSTDEIDMLVSSVKRHYKTLYGKFAKRASNKNTRQRAWMDILRKVNGVSIERRTLQEVKNKWKKCQSVLKENGTYALLGSNNNIDEDPDSMPLMERMLKPESTHQQKVQQQVLKSQPLSPTKLKVTRQGTKVRPAMEPPPSLPPAELTPVNEEMCLRWNSHHSNMQTAFPNILNKEQYVDCTLAAEGKTLKCHRMILSSCSPYFEEILSNISSVQHPVIFLKDIPFWILKSLCDFMYAGEVHIYQNKLEELLSVAEVLKIKGLAGKTNDNQESANNKTNNTIKDEGRQKRIYQQQPQQQQLKSERLINIPPLTTSQRNDYENDDVLDPLDLLEPLYEEIADEKKPALKLQHHHQQQQQQLLKKQQITKRMKKRKFPERDPSPTPVFTFRKGTRSRPNVKIPKYYHSDYDNPKPSTSTQSQTSDPLLSLDDIKTEPIDVEDNNLSDFNDGTVSPELPPPQPPPPLAALQDLPACIEISPQYHNNNNNNHNDTFNRIKLTKPIISNIHSVDDYHHRYQHDDNDNDIITPGGLEVIKITMDGNRERVNLAVNDLDVDDDDDHDGDDEHSKSPPQSQHNNDRIEIEMEVQPMGQCSNIEDSSQISQDDVEDHESPPDSDAAKDPPPSDNNDQISN